LLGLAAILDAAAAPVNAVDTFVLSLSKDAPLDQEAWFPSAGSGQARLTTNVWLGPRV